MGCESKWIEGEPGKGGIVECIYSPSPWTDTTAVKYSRHVWRVNADGTVVEVLSIEDIADEWDGYIWTKGFADPYEFIDLRQRLGRSDFHAIVAARKARAIAKYVTLESEVQS